MEPRRDAEKDFDQFDRDIQLKRAVEVLRKENRELKQLVVRLSETILRNVTAGGSPPSLFSAPSEKTSRTNPANTPPAR